MSEIEPFKFEWQGRQYRLSVYKDDNVRRHYLHADNGQWMHVERYVDPQDTVLKALLAERTRHKDVFARLMDMAREMSCKYDDESGVDGELDALQREWEGK